MMITNKSSILISIGFIFCLNCFAQNDNDGVEFEDRVLKRTLEIEEFRVALRETIDEFYTNGCTNRPEFVAQCFEVSSSQCVEVVDDSANICLTDHNNFTYRDGIYYSQMDSADTSILAQCFEANFNNQIIDLGGVVTESDSCQW